MKEELSAESYWRRRFQEAAEKHQLDEEISLQTGRGLERGIATFFRVFGRSVSSPRKVLDLGCGPGTYARLLVQQGHKVTGVDYSEAVMDKAVEKSRGLGIEYLMADARSLPFTQGSFDVVICIGLLQHLSPPSVPKVIAEIERVLAPDDGLLFLITLNTFSVKALSDRLRYRIILGPDYWRASRYNPYQVSGLLKEKGFKRCELHGVFTFPEKYTFLESLLDRLGDLSRFALPMAHSFLIKSDLAD